MVLLGAVASSAIAALPAQLQWNERVARPSPSPRAWHRMTYDVQSGRTLMFGGWDSGRVFGDTWEWDGSQWTQLQPANSPGPRCCQAMAYDLARGRIVLFGGSDGSAVDYNDTWEWDGTNWQQLTPAVSPAPRRESRMVYDIGRGRMLLFGGGDGSRVRVYADTWEWDGTSWTQLSPANRPLERWAHGMVYDVARGAVLLFGGEGFPSGINFGDTWQWNGSDWTQLSPSRSPSPREGCGMAFDWQRGVSVLYGGIAVSYTDETWEWDGTTWIARALSPRPLPRTQPSMAYDQARGRQVLFGGYDGLARGDAWELHNPFPASTQTYGTACSGSAGPPALAAASGSQPWIGMNFTAALSGVPAGQPASILFGTSRSSWAGVPLPFDLSGIGMPGCTIEAAPDVQLQLGVAPSNWTLPIPNNGWLLGQQVYAQMLALDPGTNPFGAITSNGLAMTIGAR